MRLSLSVFLVTPWGFLVCACSSPLLHLDLSTQFDLHYNRNGAREIFGDASQHTTLT